MAGDLNFVKIFMKSDESFIWYYYNFESIKMH
jgi:hypothetical protein